MLHQFMFIVHPKSLLLHPNMLHHIFTPRRGGLFKLFLSLSGPSSPRTKEHATDLTGDSGETPTNETIKLLINESVCSRRWMRGNRFLYECVFLMSAYLKKSSVAERLLLLTVAADGKCCRKMDPPDNHNVSIFLHYLY